MAEKTYGGMTYAEARLERRTLKQKLFYIRRAVEGEPLHLNAELIELKTQYEAHPKFTKWTDFPERWEIGDPYNTKESNPQFNDVDRLNLERILGKPYSEVIPLVNDLDEE